LVASAVAGYKLILGIASLKEHCFKERERNPF
jgi:hypothetical protein